MYSVMKRVLVGRPLGTHEEEHQRLSKTVALAVFSSDAISSTAYATEEILHVLVPLAAMAALGYLVPISVVVMALLAVVAFSYRQTIHAYPSGGGSYIVSRENLGVNPALVAGASLLVDYILTVAVSVSAGVLAITSAVRDLKDYKVVLGLVLVALITLANLRGLKESGSLFAIPTYTYIVILGLLVVWGLFQSFTGRIDTLPVDEGTLHHVTGGGALTGITLFALLRAFSSGAVALTGVEAISNGVPAFRRPESKNAATTLGWMAAILGSYFLGISILAQRLGPTLHEPEEGVTILSLLGKAVFGGTGPLFVVMQAATAAILTLAANTAYADFPRLASIIARDGFLPRQFANQGDRLVFSNGILVLAGAATGLLIAFRGETTALIPLYAVGVFMSFTLSQAGMVIHHRKEQEPGWRQSMVINTVGAIATGVVLLIVLISKFTIGAWVPAVVIPMIVLMFKFIHRHYARIGRQLEVPEDWRPPRINHTVVVLVGTVHAGVLQALAYARSLAPNHLAAVTVASSSDEQHRIEEQWAQHHIDIPLEILYDPYRDLTGSVLRYLDELDERWDNDIITVVIPEFVVRRWWEQLLHNQTSFFLKTRLLFRNRTVVTSIPYHLE